MARDYEYSNGLGIGVSYGPYDEHPFGASVRVAGVVKQVLVPYGAEMIPEVQNLEGRYLTPEAASRDPEGDSNVTVIPANAFIVSARFYTEADITDTGVSVGANDSDGNGDDAGFVAEVGGTSAGDWTVGAGSFVGASVGPNPLQFTSGADSITEGFGILIVEYIETPVV